jgi:MerR family transcriptional regulator, light-induced transcriptional regulator
MSQSSQNDLRQESDNRPIYNIKAVTEATGLPAATLRAWERRYGALAPSRTQSGYRLYSVRDIAVLQWLKARVDEGVTISQAIALLDYRRQGEQLRPAVERRSEIWQGLSGSRDALLAAVLAFEELQADRVLEEAFVIYGVESVIEHIVAPALALVGNLWHEGKATIAAEHFASNYLRRKLDAIINAAPRPENRRPIVLACAPEDWHELGLLLIHLLLRRRGLNSLYLGQNLPVLQFVQEMVRLQPAMVIIAATTEATVPGLIALAHAVQSMDAPKPLFGYGGRIFNERPGLRANVPGIFLGESARTAVEYVAALVADVPGADFTSSSRSPGLADIRVS